MATTGRDNRIVLRIVDAMFLLVALLAALAPLYVLLGKPDWVGWTACGVAVVILVLAVCSARVALRR